MAGTDRRRVGQAQGPVIILVRPQLGENIGATARAMMNFGLGDLRLVDPRARWPNEKARAMAAGADAILEAAQLHARTEEAIADLTLVLATTARDRAMDKPVHTPEEAAALLRGAVLEGGRVGILFGGERAGLDNDDVALARAIVTIPTNPGFGSLNLGQAVLLLAYEWFKAGPPGPVRTSVPSRAATGEELLGFFTHLEEALDVSGFLRPLEKRPSMVRNLRAIFHKAALTEQDVRTLRGVVSAFHKLRGGAGPEGHGGG
ncbi:MAG: RNA methyltransferase [Alphaproteobacteria bacterium]|nr:RNA methyltransferase [Alphaproteobacteria bacterium]